MNKKIIKVSVIIPVYNVEKYLRRCLDSVINQTLQELEIICVNDGSTDNSAKILEEYRRKDNRIIILNQENLGQGIARNLGMKIAKGKYIGFVDSDDWIDLNFFEKLYASAEKYKADAACAEILRPHKSGKISIKLRFEQEKVLTTCYEKYSVNNMPRQNYVWNKIYRKSELTRQKIFFKEGALFEDISFINHFIYFSEKIVVVPGVIYYYWANNKSVTREMRDKNQIDLIAARADLIKFSREHHIIFDEK